MPSKKSTESEISGESGRSPTIRTYEVASKEGRYLRDLAISISNTGAYQHLLESKVIGIFVVNLAGGIIDANDTFLRMVGHEREDLPMRWDIMTPRKFRYLDEEKIKEVLDTGAAMPWEKEYIRKDGTRAKVLVGASLIDGAQEREQCICFAVDLSGMERAEKARRLSERRYLTLYDNIPLMCSTVDSSGTILTINAFGAKHLGYRPDELVGQSVFAVVHPEDLDKAEQQLKAALADRGHVVRCELRKYCKDGTLLWVQETVRAVPEDGERLFVVCEDITKRRQTDEQLARYQNKLKSLTLDTVLAEERERRRIAHGLHDQVGHSLALAKMKISALPASEYPPGAQEMIADIRGYLDEAISAIRTLTFDLSSPLLYEVGLEAALQALGEQLEERTRLRVHFQCDSALKAMAEETAVIIYRVVEELLWNVFKHAEAHNVHVCVHHQSSILQISVEDDGVGLRPAEVREVPESRGRFGLFSIRARIEQLGGQFDIGASDTGGARAVLTVPSASNEISEAPPMRRGKDERLSPDERRRQREER